MRHQLAMLTVILLAACTFDAEIEISKPVILECHHRGETFQFDNSTARDGRSGFFAPSTVTITDTTGRDRVISFDDPPLCKPINLKGA